MPIPAILISDPAVSQNARDKDRLCEWKTESEDESTRTLARGAAPERLGCCHDHLFRPGWTRRGRAMRTT